MINGQKEIWVRIGNNARTPKRIIAISNCGRILRANGNIEFTAYRQNMSYNGKLIRMHVLIAKLFLHKSEDDIIKCRNIVDHITHSPENMNINDVRNLRWCTMKENSNFVEAKINRILSNTLFTSQRETWNKGLSTAHSVFGKKFVEYFNMLATADYNLYRREYRIFKRTGKCSWE